MNKEDLKKMDLISFLESLGFSPCWRRGSKAMFYSPLREEENPSFYVQRSSNGNWSWRDWGTGDRGDIIRFVELYYGVTFKEALKKLGALEEGAFRASPKVVDRPVEDRGPEWVSKYYSKGVSRMDAEKLRIVKDYFWGLGVRYYSDMKCIPVRDRKDGKLYVGIPVPYPLKMRGLELREVGGNSRKTWGKKTLWLLRRDLQRILITESILDALAGELLLEDDKITLCSLNGVGNVGQIADLVRLYKPLEVILALDSDEPGQSASLQAKELLRTYGVLRVVEYREHIEAGVKDLHKLLMLREEKAFLDRYKKIDLTRICAEPAYLS